jgi:ABC-2 type transport system ATP-binding protein
MIVLDHVSKRYGTIQAISDLSLTVDRGEMFGLIGPDGAGKSTTIRTVCGLLAADRGSVRVLDLDPRRDHRAITKSVGYLSQQFSLYGDLSVDENIAFFAEIHGMRGYAAARDRLLELTGLSRFRARLAQQLSGGMKRSWRWRYPSFTSRRSSCSTTDHRRRSVAPRVLEAAGGFCRAA